MTGYDLERRDVRVLRVLIGILLLPITLPLGAIRWCAEKVTEFCEAACCWSYRARHVVLREYVKRWPTTRDHKSAVDKQIAQR